MVKDHFFYIQFSSVKSHLWTLAPSSSQWVDSGEVPILFYDYHQRSMGHVFFLFSLFPFSFLHSFSSVLFCASGSINVARVFCFPTCVRVACSTRRTKRWPRAIWCIGTRIASHDSSLCRPHELSDDPTHFVGAEDASKSVYMHGLRCPNWTYWWLH